ncbi:MAG: hypothetical protein HLX50_13365 [Alteromonadaceae bacterium]|nr:hypothetical protein [Alteromonadaceae bacterium]
MISGREYKYKGRGDINSYLDKLIAPSVSVSEYRDSMYCLGKYLAETLLSKLNPDESYCIVSTAEDADFLSKGLIEVLRSRVKDLKIACFWNFHSQPVKGGESTAPILRKFIEKGAEAADNLIVTKSVISGSCVVKTNLTALIENMSPRSIYVVAPVMHKDATTKLAREFPPGISQKFDYEYFATDVERDPETNEVIPGIGGNVYQLLGFQSQTQKNRYMPEILNDMIFGR